VTDSKRIDTALILFGHGSRLDAAGEHARRCVDELKRAQIFGDVRSCCLYYTTETLPGELDAVISQKFKRIIIAPFFLNVSAKVKRLIERLIEAAQAQHAGVKICVSEGLIFHENMPNLICELIDETIGPAASSHSHARSQALLLIAHGSRHKADCDPIEAIAKSIALRTQFAHVTHAFLELAQPSIEAAIDDLVQSSATDIIVMPLFLHIGGHMAEDIPAALSRALSAHKNLSIRVTPRIGESPKLWRLVADAAMGAIEHRAHLPTSWAPSSREREDLCSHDSPASEQ